MKAEAEDLASGERIEVDIPDENWADLQSLAIDRVNDAELAYSGEREHSIRPS